MTKKRLLEIFGVKTEVFSGKSVIQVHEKFFVPPNSAPGLRLWLHITLLHNTRHKGAWRFKRRLAYLSQTYIGENQHKYFPQLDRQLDSIFLHTANLFVTGC